MSPNYKKLRKNIDTSMGDEKQSTTGRDKAF